MGHQHIGRLPRTRRWREVIALLGDDPRDAPRLADAVLRAMQERLAALRDDPGFTYCCWLLVRLTWAARGGDFAGDAARLGVPIDPSESPLAFVARITDEVSETVTRYPSYGPLTELAVQSLGETLLDTVGSRTPGMFARDGTDLQRDFRRRSTESGFSTLTKHFFGDFIARTLRYVVGREVLAHVGPALGMTTVQDARDVDRAVTTHARETVRVMEQFSGEWYGKHNHHSAGEISREETNGFAAHALDKVRAVLALEAQPA